MKTNKPKGECPTPEQASQYEGIAGAVADRISKLIPKHPEILTMKSPDGLMKIPGFDCDDLAPSYAQVSVALQLAQRSARK